MNRPKRLMIGISTLLSLIRFSGFTMKLFRLIRIFYKKLGLTDDSTIQLNQQQKCRFNFKNIFILICMIHMCISSLGFFLFKAITIDEHAESFFSFLSELLPFEQFFVVIWKLSDMVESIEKYEQFIEKSEYC